MSLIDVIPCSSWCLFKTKKSIHVEIQKCVSPMGIAHPNLLLLPPDLLLFPLHTELQQWPLLTPALVLLSKVLKGEQSCCFCGCILFCFFVGVLLLLLLLLCCFLEIFLILAFSQETGFCQTRCFSSPRTTVELVQRTIGHWGGRRSRLLINNMEIANWFEQISCS